MTAPVYGPRLIGAEEFARQTQEAQRTGDGVYGTRMTSEPSVWEPPAEAVPAPKVAAVQAASVAHIRAMIGTNYTVNQAEQALALQGNLAVPLLEAEMARPNGPRRSMLEALALHFAGLGRPLSSDEQAAQLKVESTLVGWAVKGPPELDASP